MPRQSRRVKLTRAFIARVVAGTEDPGPWTDTESPLRLKGTAGGGSYSVMRKVGGRVTVFTPKDAQGQPVKNSAGVLTLDQARKWARELTARLALGQEAQPVRLQTRTTFAKLSETYLDAYKGSHAPTSVRSETWGVKYACAVLGPLAPAQIDAAALERLKQHHAGSPANLRSAWGAAKRVLDVAVMRGLISANPVAALPAPKPPRAKDRYPELSELAAIWHACTETQGVGAAIVQFAIALPLRAGTLTSLTWGEVDLKQCELRLQPAAGRKFQGVQRLPLPGLACELLTARWVDGTDASALVFGSDSPKNPGGVFSGWSAAVKRIQKRAGVANWSPHDFRRSMVSIVAEHRPDVSEAALDRLLTHAQSSTNTGVKAVYQRAAGFRGMQIAADAWDQLLRSALAPTVVQLDQRAAG